MNRDEQGREEPGGRERAGLRTPHAGALAGAERPRRWSVKTIALQTVGFLIGAGLLIWAISLALSPENQEGIDRLLDASWGPIAGLIALCSLNLLLNGLAFWVCILPVRRVPWLDMFAVNAVASLLAYVPFKLSVFARVIVHRQRHRMPFREIFAMMGAIGVVLVSVLGPLSLAGVALSKTAIPWWIVGGVGVALSLGVSIVAGGVFLRYEWLDHVTLGAGRLLRAHWAVAWQAALRLADLLAQAGRFLIVAAVIGADLPLADALLLASTYFLVGMLSPAGNFGTREGVVAGLGALGLGLTISAETGALLALIITAAEIVTNAVFGVASAIWLRIDRLFLARGAPVEAYAPGDAAGQAA